MGGSRKVSIEISCEPAARDAPARIHRTPGICPDHGPRSPSRPEVADGDRGKDAKGLPKLGKNLHDNEFTKSQSDAELVEFLKVGRQANHPLNETGVDMPPKGGDPSISDEDLVNVVAFLRTL